MAAADDAAQASLRKAAARPWLLASPALVVLFVAAIGPLAVMAVYSFLLKGDYGGVQWQFSLDAWTSVFFERDIFDGTLGLADAHLSIFWRSISLSLLTTLLCFIFGFPTAYFIATRPRASRDIWLFLVTIPFWTNLLIRTFAIQEIIRSEGAINTLLLRIGAIEAPLQMLYTDFAIALGMVYVYLPLMVLPLYASMEKLDFRLVEAGYDLYATRFQVLRRIIVPLVKPGIVAGCILVFVPSLGAYVTPRVLGGGKNLMIGNLVELQFGQGRNWPLGAALGMLLLAIVILAMLVYLRQTRRQEVRAHD